MKRFSTLILLAGAALLVAACGASEESATTIPPTTTTTPAAATEPALQSPLQPGDAPEAASPQRAAASAAIEDLAGRLGAAPEAIAVVEVNEVDWPDASLGCPAPDMAYAQVITPGMQVILESDGKIYAYHGRSPGDLFLCEADGPAPPVE